MVVPTVVPLAVKFLRSLLILGRVSNLPTVWTNVIVGWLVGGGSIDSSIAWLICGVSLLYWAGMTLNDAFDVQWDRSHAPERPIPSGAVSAPTVWVIGILQMIAGVCLILWKSEARWELLLALVFCILLYDWIHKKWKGAVLIMGLCRALVYLLAWSDARSEMKLGALSPLIYFLGGGVLLYIAGITLVARSERKKATSELGALPRMLLLVPTSFPVLVLYCEPGTMDLSIKHIFGGIITSCVWIVFFRSLLTSGKIPGGIAYAIAGIALYDATVAILFDQSAGFLCLACFGLTLLAQRFVPAT